MINTSIKVQKQFGSTPTSVKTSSGRYSLRSGGSQVDNTSIRSNSSGGISHTTITNPRAGTTAVPGGSVKKNNKKHNKNYNKKVIGPASLLIDSTVCHTNVQLGEAIRAHLSPSIIDPTVSTATVPPGNSVLSSVTSFDISPGFFVTAVNEPIGDKSSLGTMSSLGQIEKIKNNDNEILINNTIHDNNNSYN